MTRTKTLVNEEKRDTIVREENKLEEMGNEREQQMDKKKNERQIERISLRREKASRVSDVVFFSTIGKKE